MNTAAHLGFPEMCDISFLFGFIVSVGIGLFAFIVTAMFSTKEHKIFNYTCQFVFGNNQSENFIRDKNGWQQFWSGF